MDTRKFFLLLVGVAVVASSFWGMKATAQPDFNLSFEKEYLHSDAKTTAILNFIAGKSNLPPHLQAELEIKVLCKMVAEERVNGENKDADSNLLSLEERLLDLVASEADILTYRRSAQFIEDAIDVYFYYWFTPGNHTDSVRTWAVIKDLVPRLGMSQETLASMSPEQLKGIVAESIVDFSKITIQLKDSYSPKRYRAIWSLHHAHGNPRLDFSKDFSGYMECGSRASYDPVSNTIYLGLFFYELQEDIYFFEDWMAELAHAEQYVNQYSKETLDYRSALEESYLQQCWLKGISGGDQTEENKVAFSRALIQEIYSDERMFDGYPSIEFEAHKQIEPQLWQEYEALLQ